MPTEAGLWSVARRDARLHRPIMTLPARRPALKPIRRLEFRHRLTLFGVILVVVVTLLSSTSTYSLARTWLESSQQNELLAIVNTAAPQINGDLLALVSRRSDGSLQGEDEFLEIQRLLDDVVARNHMSSHGSPLYIMRPTPDYVRTAELEFVVMARGGEAGHFVGNTVRAAEHLPRALSGTPAASGLYQDAEGMWISAAAPIFDSRSVVVGLLQADRSVDWFNQRAREQLKPLLTIAVLGVTLSGFLAAGFARGLSRPVRILVSATHEIADGNLEHRIPIERNDELGDLAMSVNQMSGRLRLAQTELEGQRQQLSDALDAAHGASRAKSEFLANMSHELRTPLNAVIGYAEMLAEDAAADGRTSDEADLNQILVAARHLLNLIVTVLDFAKADAHRIELNLRRHLIGALTDEALAMVQPLVRKNRNHLAVSNELEGQSIVVDAFRLQQCLLNLIGNASKFTSNGRIGLDVTSCYRDGTAGVAWAVSDTGVGIRAEDQAKLFVAFSQVDSAPTRRNGGTGLGLALTARLCQLMGGEVTVTSELGRGSTFTIWLPVHPPNETASRMEASEAESPPPGTETPQVI